MRVLSGETRPSWVDSRTSRLWTLGAGGAALLVVSSMLRPPPWLMLVAGLAGMAGLVCAWLALGRHTRFVDIPTMYRIGLSWCLPVLVAPPLFSADVSSYLAQGLTVARGLSPYLVG